MPYPPTLSSVETETELRHEPEVVVYSPHLDRSENRDVGHDGDEKSREREDGGDARVIHEGEFGIHFLSAESGTFDALRFSVDVTCIHAATPHSSNTTATTQLVLTPLLFTSFLLSLFLVDRRNRAYRRAQHPSSTARSSSRPSWSLTQWLDPEPYAYFTAPHATSTTPTEKHVRRYAIGKKHRAIWGLELDQAFELRGRVVVVVALGLAVLAGVVLGVGVVAGWVWWRG
ncbi:hypothetical protein K490DRAFT_59846 [Saccharata proteae CBS 121410]|uniref:Uncharacterized protein n=1 Tax=Saccharata proteae CBS 121410 TaxID=1314787 RepID=A0A9P4LUG6_9PEZI|nr:hypothetical protein K490DRAFT_59846 [Saccharata proteae CBS 121410]